MKLPKLSFWHFRQAHSDQVLPPVGLLQSVVLLPLAPYSLTMLSLILLGPLALAIRAKA